MIDLALEHARETGVSDRVTPYVGDLTELLSTAAAEPAGRFDAIWAGDVIWSGNFEDPAATVRLMAQALRPGGVLAVFYSNYYQATFLPGRAGLERRLRTASERPWGLPSDGGSHYERHVEWLLAAGLDDVGATGLSAGRLPSRP